MKTVKHFPRPAKPDDLLDDQPWPSFEFHMKSDYVIPKDEPLRFSISWTDMPVGSAIKMGMTPLPLPDRAHGSKGNDRIVAEIGGIMRMTEVSGSLDVEWILRERTPVGNLHLIATFVEGTWLDSPGKSTPAAMPSRKGFEGFIGPLLRLAEPSPRSVRPVASETRAPIDLQAIARDLSSLTVLQAMELVHRMEKDFNLASTSRNRQSWPFISMGGWGAMCGVGMGRRQDPTYPIFSVKYNNHTRYPRWDLVLFAVKQDQVLAAAEVIKTIWSCGSAEALTATKNLPVAIANGLSHVDMDHALEMFDDLDVDLRVLRSL